MIAAEGAADAQNVDEAAQALRDAGARATFFLVGPLAERHPELVRAIAAAVNDGTLPIDDLGHMGGEGLTFVRADEAPAGPAEGAADVDGLDAAVALGERVAAELRAAGAH